MCNQKLEIGPSENLQLFNVYKTIYKTNLRNMYAAMQMSMPHESFPGRHVVLYYFSNRTEIYTRLKTYLLKCHTASMILQPFHYVSHLMLRATG